MRLSREVHESTPPAPTAHYVCSKVKPESQVVLRPAGQKVWDNQTVNPGPGCLQAHKSVTSPPQPQRSRSAASQASAGMQRNFLRSSETLPPANKADVTLPPSLAATVAKLCGFSVRKPPLGPLVSKRGAEDARDEIKKLKPALRPLCESPDSGSNVSRAANGGVCHQLPPMAPSGPQSKLAPHSPIERSFL